MPQKAPTQKALSTYRMPRSFLRPKTALLLHRCSRQWSEEDVFREFA